MSATAAGPAASAELERQYRAGRDKAILVDRSALGRLAIRGRDALDLLHRLSTNDIKGLKLGEGAVTVFTTAKGRILDLVTLHCLEDRILGLTGEGGAGPLMAWIERYTFREQVTVEDQSQTHATLGIFGPKAANMVRDLFGREAAERPLHQPIGVAVGTLDAVLARTYPVVGEGFLLTAEAGAMPTVRAGLLLAGEGRMVAAGPECYDILRIESGLPAPGRELTQDYNPWEARLNDAISLSKGCYVGQEVVARLNTYRKVSKQLVRLRIDAGFVPPARAPLRAGTRPAGAVTSAARIPGTARAVALAYVNDEDAVAGRELHVESEGAPQLVVVEGVAR